MGGGAAMRAVGKFADIGLINRGLRGVPVAPPAEQLVSAAARKVSRPVSATVSSNNNGHAGEVTSATVQRPSWEIEDWEFAGGEEEIVLNSGDPMPRVVFGGVPTLNEAKAATSELKDALEMVYLKSPNSTGYGDSFTVSQGSGLPVLLNSEYSETKACLASETTVTPMAPKHALQAFRLISENPETQTVVASIACDVNVWNAVMKNEALVEYLRSQKTSASSPVVDQSMKEFVADGEFQEQESPKNDEESSNASQSGNTGSGFMNFVENVKLAVADMVTNLSGFIHSIFGGPAAENKSVDADANDGATFVDRTLGASLMALGMLVVMVVVLKRG